MSNRARRRLIARVALRSKRGRTKTPRVTRTNRTADDDAHRLVCAEGMRQKGVI